MTSYELARATTTNALESGLEEAVRDVGAKRFALHLASAVIRSGESEETLVETLIDAVDASFVSKEEHDKALADAEDHELEIEREKDEAEREKEETVEKYAKIGEAVRDLRRLFREASGEDDEDAILIARLRKENTELRAEISKSVSASVELATTVREQREQIDALRGVEPYHETKMRRGVARLEEKLAAYEIAHRRLAASCKAEKQKKILAETAECLAAIERNFT